MEITSQAQAGAATLGTARYAVPELKDLPDDIRAKVLEVQEKAGFVPNVFLALARRPAEWRAFLLTTML